MKTINFELSKRLNDLWLLDNIETKTMLVDDRYSNWFFNWKYYKTLTLEEAIEFILKNVKVEFRNMISLQIFFRKDWIHYCIDWIWEWIWESQIEAIEKILEYLLDNNLLTK